MKLFLDGAIYDEITQGVDWGVVEECNDACVLAHNLGRRMRVVRRTTP